MYSQGSRNVAWNYAVQIFSWRSPMTIYAAALDSHSYQTLSTVVVCPSLDISTASTPDRIITELSRPASRAHLTTGYRGLVVQGNPGSEPQRPTCNLWILDWRLRSDALRTDRLGGNSWQSLNTSSVCMESLWRRLGHAPEERVHIDCCCLDVETFKCETSLVMTWLGRIRA